MKDTYYVAFDIGETFIKGIVISNFAHKNMVVCQSKSKTRGISHGDISSASDLKLAINQVKSDLETKIGDHISNALILLPSSKAKVYHVSRRFDLSRLNRSLTSRDFSDMRLKINSSVIPSSEVVTNYYDVSYKLDNNDSYSYEPINAYANEVEINLSIITLPMFVARSYTSVFEDLGINILYASTSLLNNYPQVEDVLPYVLVDIGGENTSVALYQNNKLMEVMNLRSGGALVSRFLEAHYKLPFENLEELKIIYGSANPQTSEMIPLYNDLARGLVITEYELSSLVRESLEEYLNELTKVYLNITKHGSVKVYLLGGGSNLKELDSIISSRLGVEAIKINNNYIGARGSEFLPLIGLINYYLDKLPH